MKKVVMFVTFFCLVFAGVHSSFGADKNAFDKLNGGNVLQSLEEAAKRNNVTASFDTGKIEINNGVAVITGMATDNIMFVITLYRESAKIKTLILMVPQWTKQEAAHAVLSIMGITQIMGQLVHPGITEDALGKMYGVLVGKRMESLDGEPRKARLDGVLLGSGYAPGAGFVLTATPDSK